MPVPPGAAGGAAVPFGALGKPPAAPLGAPGKPRPGPRPGPPPGPRPKPVAPATAGPALGIEPVCAVVAVCTAYAAGPARPASRPTDRTVVTTARPTRSTTNRPTEAASPATRMSHLSQGRNSADRPSTTKDQQAVTNRVVARTMRARVRLRRCHSNPPPIPTSAAIAGARATV